MRQYALALIAAAALQADIIDRVAVSVDNDVIAESEVVRQIRITALLNDEPVLITPERKRETAERLVEQMLIRREIESTRYLLEDPQAYIPLYETLRKRMGGDAAYKAALDRYNVTDSDVRNALHWQAMLLEFIQVRFRPGIQASEAEIREYYEQEVATKPGPPPFEKVREEIETLLTEQRLNASLDRWLGQARRQSQIRYRPEVFR
jgi:peptidyl-prolyl cis-trans isomerase SurA